MSRINRWTTRQTASSEEEATRLAFEELKESFDITEEDILVDVLQKSSGNFYDAVVEVTLTQEAIERLEEEEAATSKPTRGDIARTYYNSFIVEKGIDEIPDDCIKNGDYVIFINNKNFYVLEKPDRFVSNFVKGTDDISAPEYLEILFDDIVYFEREGDVHLTTSVSGGGGGGYSLKGAILGGIIAGGAGAIIGSRKKTNEIVSETNITDTRVTKLYYKKNDGIYTYDMVGIDLYDYLLRMIPEKDYRYASMKNLLQDDDNNNSQKQIDEQVDVKQRLRDLKDLFDEGLITDEEFAAKRKELIDLL